jgi:hypothetical protein
VQYGVSDVEAFRAHILAALPTPKPL